jgi:hypothetical protein
VKKLTPAGNSIFVSKNPSPKKPFPVCANQLTMAYFVLNNSLYDSVKKYAYLKYAKKKMLKIAENAIIHFCFFEAATRCIHFPKPKFTTIESPKSKTNKPEVL